MASRYCGNRTDTNNNNMVKSKYVSDTIATSHAHDKLVMCINAGTKTHGDINTINTATTSSTNNDDANATT